MLLAGRASYIRSYITYNHMPYTVCVRFWLNLLICNLISHPAFAVTRWMFTKHKPSKAIQSHPVFAVTPWMFHPAIHSVSHPAFAVTPWMFTMHTSSEQTFGAVSVYAFVCMCVSVRVCVCVCLSVRISVCLCVCICVPVCACVCVCMCVCMSVRKCMCVCAYICTRLKATFW